MSENLIGFDFRKQLANAKLATMDLNAVSLEARAFLESEIKQGKIETEAVTSCLCGSSQLEPLTTVDRFGLSFGSSICVDCGLVLTTPRISESSLPRYYDLVYHRLNYGRQHLNELGPLFGNGQGQKIFGLVEPLLRLEEPLRVLEVGSGTGSVLRELLDEAERRNCESMRAIGTEFSQECIDISESRNGDRPIRYIKGGLKEAAHHAGEGFHLIILSHVFEHFTNPRHALEQIKSLLTQEGLLYIEVPGIYRIHRAAYYKCSFLGYLTHAHMYHFTASSLSNLVRSGGFELKFVNEGVESLFGLKSKPAEELSHSPDIRKNCYQSVLAYLEFLQHEGAHLNNQFVRQVEITLEIRRNEKKIEHLKSSVEEFETLKLARGARKFARLKKRFFAYLKRRN